MLSKDVINQYKTYYTREHLTSKIVSNMNHRLTEEEIEILEQLEKHGMFDIELVLQSELKKIILQNLDNISFMHYILYRINLKILNWIYYEVLIQNINSSFKYVEHLAEYKYIENLIKNKIEEQHYAAILFTLAQR